MAQAALILLIAVGALLPFERIGGVSLSGLNVRASQVGLALAWSAFLFAWLSGRVPIAWRRPAFLALAGFFAATGLSLLNTENLPRSIAVLGFTLFTASLTFLLPHVFTDGKKLASARNAILVSAAVVSIFGLWQFVGDMLGAPLWLTGLRDTYSRAVLGFTRIQSTAAEPLYFADYLLLPVALCAAWLLRGTKHPKALALLLGAMLIDIFLTSSRGGWLGFGVTAVTLGWIERRRFRDPKLIVRGGAIALAALGIGVLLLGRFFSPTAVTVSESFYRHVTNLFGGAAYDDRAQTISSALDAWRRHPWIGVGFGGYGPTVSPFPYAAPEAGWPIVNNETLELLAETGIAGLLAFLVFLICVFREGVCTREQDGTGDGTRSAIRSACLAALCGMLVQYQTFSTLYVLHVWFTIGLLLAASRSSGDLDT